MPIRKTKISSSRFTLAFTVVVAALGMQAVAAAQSPTKAKPTPKEGMHKPEAQTFVLVGAGDIASCKQLDGARATANLIEKIPGVVFAAGDLAYENGSDEDFKDCYSTTWGKFKDRTRPALGNHEYESYAAQGYFDYWGMQAGPSGKGYYSYDLGDWHIVVLNTNCNARGLGGCGGGSPQEIWLKADLAEHAKACLLAYGHHALFSSGILKKHAIHPELKQFWQDLYAARADVILAGHEHSYERFAPQDPEGNPDPVNGIREIVAGTGGRSHDLLGFATPNSEVRNWDTYGVLKLTLSPGIYVWEFIPEEGKSFRDEGNGVCHNQPSGTN